MTRGPIHLVSRFFDVAFSQPLAVEERAYVARWLEPSLLELFREQPTADQRHAYRGALRLETAGRPDLIPAILLHDVGKRHSGLGVMGRVAATLAELFRIDGGDAFRIHRNHGAIGANELARRDADPIAVDFARYHAQERPDSIDPESWALLLDADTPPKPRALLAGR